MIKTRIVALLTGLMISGCTSGFAKPLPYDAWFLGFFAPSYMEVWIETADVVDVDEHLYRQAMSGIAAIQTPPENRGNPKGWPEHPGMGKGKHVTGARLPKLIYVRWQSLAEPQTYDVYIEVTPEIRALMVESEEVYCRPLSKQVTDHRKVLTVGLAPGGIAKAWVGGPCLTSIEVARVAGKVVTRGPYLGKMNGVYAAKLRPESQTYVNKFGIPFGSW
ncbi:DUF2931 family protein [Pseudomonas sp. gcc21]|uniref:DUF2931 family protein n=1 Tax=Pseudomonas sp. gcc21 TaxID=2726989 RepID=UPI0014514DA0|nr:DUF2931 family protein [Pseudomonas sp. gcc21]QJD57911.1 DUF2931 family protein [Pseudomonas sp. gcc21]